MSNVTPIDFLPDKNKQSTAIAYAYVAYGLHKLTSEKITNNKHMLVVDFTQPSWKKRMCLVEIDTGNIVRNHHAAHGDGSSNSWDKANAIYFSNVNNSHKSSLGSMVTSVTYSGKHGRSRRLIGLDVGVNDNVFRRAIVIHRSLYVTDNYISGVGRAGCSWGCLAIDPTICDTLIDLVPEGTFVYIHGVNQDE